MKRIVVSTLRIFYLTALLFSAVLFIKPGASVFYKRIPIQTQRINRLENAFEVKLYVNSRIYNPGTVLVFEDQKILSATTPENAEAGASGTIALNRVDPKQISVLFNPTAFSDPALNGHQYTIYIRPYLISRQWGAVAFVFLALGLLAFFPGVQAALQKSRIPFLSMFSAAVFQAGQRAAAGSSSFLSRRASIWKQAIPWTILAAFLYILMEWIFFITKPSFMDILSPAEKIKVFWVTGLAASLLALLILPAILLMDIVLSPLLPAFRKYAYTIPAAFVTASLCLILFDNFTYTLFKTGIVNSKNLMRAVYALAFLAGFTAILKRFPAEAKTAARRSDDFASRAAFAMVSISLIVAGITYRSESSAITREGQGFSVEKQPNIILLSTDGLNADNLSAYGYERNTTPFIAELAKTSLLSMNHFTNAGTSMGSETAVLTGKLPFTTRVIYSPNTLTGTNKYQHLPGLLKRSGYRTASLGVQYFVDVNAINFQNAFDEVNCIENPADSLSSRLSGRGYDDEIYLANTILERIGDRLKHIFFIKEMGNPYAQVNGEITSNLSDRQRLQCLRLSLDASIRSGQPLFSHIHLMATHGGKFYPSSQVFSKDKNQDQDWMADFYDDAILDFDQEIQQLVQYLEEKDVYDHTLLVLYTDHGQQYSVANRIPLIIHFPGGQHAGVITENTQNIDIAPTVLDYLGINKPAWMEGSSLLEPLDPGRLIAAGFPVSTDLVSGEWTLSQKDVKPPFYMFGLLSVIQCQNLYIFNLQDSTTAPGTIHHYINPCPAETLDSPDAIREKAGRILTRAGFDLPEGW